MKKNLLLLGLAVAAMTSCSNDKLLDQVEPIQRAIGFESFVNKTTKTVTETTASGLTKFMAYGYYMAPDKDVVNSTTTTVFDGTAVVYDVNTGKWDYTDGNTANLKYWTANKYWFAGYANQNESTSIEDVEFNEETTDEAGTTTTYGVLSIPSYTAKNNEDLVAGVVSVDNTSNNPQNVSLSFEHLLTKVQFTVTNNDSKYKMRITSALEVNGIQTTADCKVTSTAVTWSNHKTELDNFKPVATTAEDTYLNPGASSTSTVSFVLPQDLENVTFSENSQLEIIGDHAFAYCYNFTNIFH